MPIYEFVCEDCAASFDELVRSSAAVGEVNCPVCRSRKVRKKISLVAARGGGREVQATSSAACTTST